MNYLKFTNDKLSVEDVSKLVISPSCDAIFVFAGRNDNENKNTPSVLSGAYEQIALKSLTDLCREMRNRWQSVENIAIYYRLGTVPLKEVSFIIAVSSCHRTDAIFSTEWCIQQLKQFVAIWEKQMHEEYLAEWNEDKESLHSSPKPKKPRVNLEQKVLMPCEPPHFQQINVPTEEMNRRLKTFLSTKMNEVNIKNIAEFCSSGRSSEFKCARIDSIMKKQRNSKGHVQVDRVLNTYHRDQFSSEYLTKYIPPNGVEERLQNLENQLSLKTPAPNNIYKRIKILEDKMLELESISPEYIQFWDKGNNKYPKSFEKKKFSIEEIDSLIRELENDNI